MPLLPKDTTIYDDIKNPIEIIKKRNQKNSEIELIKKYALDAMLFLTEFNTCTNIPDQDFNTERLVETINGIGYEVNWGETILRTLNGIPDQEVIILRQGIEKSIKTLNKNGNKLSEFLERTKLLPKYKEDVKKHQGEILQALEVL